MAIAVGEWDDDAAASDRVSVGLEARPAVTGIQFTILEPEDSPWANTTLLGAMLTPQTAFSHPVLPEIFEVAKCVVTHDERVASFLEQS